MTLKRDSEGRVQYPCRKCLPGTVTQYENGSACDNCGWGVTIHD